MKPLIEKIQSNSESFEKVKQDIESYEKELHRIQSNYKIVLENSDITPDYSSLKAWYLKLTNLSSKQNKTKSSPVKSVSDLITKIKREDIQKAFALYQPKFDQMSPLASKIIQELTQLRETQELLEPVQPKNKVSLKKLEQQLKKAQSSNDPLKIKEYKDQIDKINKWYQEFKSTCALSEGNLKKELKSSPKKLLTKTNELIEKRNKLKLELTCNESKQLERARKWSQLVVDSNIIMSSKSQTEVGIERIYDIQTLLERIKTLDDIDSVKNLRSELVKINDWHQSLDKTSEYNEVDGKLIKIDREQLKKLIVKAKSEIKINIQTEIQEIEDQLLMNEAWETKSQNILSCLTYDSSELIDQAKEILDQIENDKEETFNLIDKQLVRKVRLWYIKAKYVEQKNKKKDVFEFVFALEREIAKMTDFQAETDLEQEIKMLELAKKLKQSFGSKNTITSSKQTTNQVRTLTLEDVDYLLNQDNDLPFVLEKKMIDNLQKQKTRFEEELSKEFVEIMNKNPSIEEYDKVLTKLKELTFITPDERAIEKMKKNYTFIMEMVKEYPPLEERKVKPEKPKKEKKEGEDSLNSESSNEEEEQQPRFLTDFAKVHKKFFKLKCLCPEAVRLVQEYDKARSDFDSLKQEFQQKKLENNFTFQDLSDINDKLINITLDFEDEELQFRQGIWHARVQKVLSEVQNYTCNERVNSEIIRFWLEEGQELEVVNDIKYEKLNEVVEDIDHITRALKMCATVEEVDKIDEQENRKLIQIVHLIRKARERVKKGDIPKYVKKSNEQRKGDQNTSCALEYLKNSRMKMNGEQKDDVDMAPINQEDDEDDDMDTDDLEDEKDDEEGNEEESSKKKRKRPSKPSASKDVKTNKFAPKSDKFAKPTISGFKPKAVSSEPKKRVKKQAEKTEDGEKKQTKKTAVSSQTPAEGGSSALDKLKKKIIKKKEDQEKDKENKEAAGDEENATDKKKVIKGLGGGLKLGGAALKATASPKKPILPTKKKFETPQKKEQAEEKMEIDEDNSTLNKQKDEETRCQQDDTAEGSECNQPKEEAPKKKEVKPKKKIKEEKPEKPKEEPKEKEKPKGLLAKRPIAKSTVAAKPKEPEEKKEEKLSQKQTESKAPAIAKKVGLIKKTGGGGLAASLAKINK